MAKDEKIAEVQHLITVGKEKGYLTYDELNNALPEDFVSSDEMDSIMMMFGEMEIDIVDQIEEENYQKLVNEEEVEEEDVEFEEIIEQDIEELKQKTLAAIERLKRAYREFRNMHKKVNSGTLKVKETARVKDKIVSIKSKIIEIVFHLISMPSLLTW